MGRQLMLACLLLLGCRGAAPVGSNGPEAAAPSSAPSAASSAPAPTPPPAGPYRVSYGCSVNDAHFGGTGLGGWNTSVDLAAAKGTTRRYATTRGESEPHDTAKREAVFDAATVARLDALVRAALAEPSPADEPGVMDGGACSLFVLRASDGAQLLRVQRQRAVADDAVDRLVLALQSLDGLKLP